MINKDTYKRLTAKKEDRYWKQDEFWQSAQEPSYEEIEELYSRHAEFEDKIENGTLVELPFVAYNVKECKYQIISLKNGRIYASKFYRTREQAEARLRELQEVDK